MAIFDELTKKAQAAGEKLKDIAGAAGEKAKDLAEAAGEKAKAASDSAKVKVAILAEQRELEKNYRAIGEWFVSEYEGEMPDAVKDVVAAIEASKAKIAELQAKEEPEAEEEKHVLKTCPVCGAASDSKFCPECGDPMGEE